MFDLSGCSGLITGGCGPLGWAMAEALARQGAHVVVADLPAAIKACAGSPVDRVHPHECDLMQDTSLSDLTRMVELDLGSLDFLINNAAFTGDSQLGGYSVPFHQQTDDAFDKAIHLNLSVPFRLARVLSPLLAASSNGSILNIASIYGLVGPVMGLYEGTSMGNPAAYSASKGGLVQLTRYLATVLAPNVRVNCIAPGGISRGQDETFVARYEARTPLARMATEQDVVGAAVWLVSGAAAYVTGQTVAIDGGWTAW